MQAVSQGHREGFLDKSGAALGKELAQVGVTVPGAGIPRVRESFLQGPIQAGDAISVPGKLSFGGLTPKTGSRFKADCKSESIRPSVCPHTPPCLRSHHSFFGGGNQLSCKLALPRLML